MVVLKNLFDIITYKIIYILVLDNFYKSTLTYSKLKCTVND